MQKKGNGKKMEQIIYEQAFKEHCVTSNNQNERQKAFEVSCTVFKRHALSLKAVSLQEWRQGPGPFWSAGDGPTAGLSGGQEFGGHASEEKHPRHLLHWEAHRGAPGEASRGTS